MRVSCAGIWSEHFGNPQWHFRAEDSAAVPAGWVLLYEWVSAEQCHGDPGCDWHSGWHHQPRAALPGTGNIPGRCQTQAGTHWSALMTNTCSLLRKDVLVYQTVLGMKINQCNCRINGVNSCKIKAWLFSEILPKYTEQL